MNNLSKGAMFSSASDEWETPQYLFDSLNKQFDFELDVCSTFENAKCEKFYTREQDGLAQPWFSRNWMNPPYGRQIARWIEKAYQESVNGKLTVCLLPARTDTKWFHSYIQGKAEVNFIKGRLKFGSSKNSAPFPSMIVIYDPAINRNKLLHRKTTTVVKEGEVIKFPNDETNIPN